MSKLVIVESPSKSKSYCAALDRNGNIAWIVDPPAHHSAAIGLAPALHRNVLLIPGEPILALDPAGGERLGSAPLVAPEQLIVDDDLGIVAIDSEGAVAAARLTRRLAVAGDCDA